MSDDVTARFFHWMESHNITRPTAAALLGVDERSLSTYRSRGLPRKKQARALQIMAAHEQSPGNGATQDQRVTVDFNDEDYDLVSRAAVIVGSEIREFIVKSAITKAREEISHRKDHPPPFELPMVAEDPTPYRVRSQKKH